ncbi:MAG: hypothetical protein JSS65_03410 [Armatimonadetes bacterium]|nr:hypothetical protein [Armatimonadota bacterium]
MAMAVTYATVNGRLVQENRGGTVTRYVSDTLGSCVQTRDSAGNVTSTTEYWPYGEVRTSTGTNPSPWGFVGLLGYLTDTVSRLYVRMRHYRPGLTRWQTVDPIWPSHPPYHYANLASILFIDPYGLFFVLPLGPILAPFVPGTLPIDTIGSGGIGIGNPEMQVDYHYGTYCGAKNPPCPTTSRPKDCLDQACYDHDQRTMNQSMQQFMNNANAHCRLAADAAKCIYGGCLVNNSGSILGVIECVEAAKQVLYGYSLFCAYVIGSQLGGSRLWFGPSDIPNGFLEPV